jgi:hypothetical protein
MNGEDVECVLYRTPVVTFHTDDTVTIKTDSWNTVSTHQFIWAITGCKTHGKAGNTVILVDGGWHVISKSMKLKRVADGAVKWEVLTSEEQYDWRINKAKASEARQKYKKFLTFIRNGLKIRMNNEYAHFNSSELADEFGIKNSPWGGSAVDTTEIEDLSSKKSKVSQKFMDLINRGEDYEAYYKAMLILACASLSHSHYSIKLSEVSYGVSPRSIINKAYEIMYKWHSDEVFVRVKLDKGVVPSKKYDNWVS